MRTFRGNAAICCLSDHVRCAPRKQLVFDILRFRVTLQLVGVGFGISASSVVFIRLSGSMLSVGQSSCKRRVTDETGS